MGSCWTKGGAGSALVSVQVLTKQYQKHRTVTAAAARAEDGLALQRSGGGQAEKRHWTNLAPLGTTADVLEGLSDARLRLGVVGFAVTTAAAVGAGACKQPNCWRTTVERT